jgi:hypothetical protein
VCGLRAPGRSQVLIKQAGRIGIAAPFRETADLEDAHSVVERDCQHVTQTRTAAGRIDALAIEADMTGGGERRSGAAGAYHARMPQPFIYALAVQA